jgi:hypothetical protein
VTQAYFSKILLPIQNLDAIIRTFFKIRKNKKTMVALMNFDPKKWVLTRRFHLGIQKGAPLPFFDPFRQKCP